MQTIGERIRLARESKNLQQKELAELINVKSSGVISNWERDLNKPDAEKIIKLCQVLNISVSYLLDYYGNSDFQCTLSEQDHIKKYRTLDKYSKKAIDNLLNNEYERTMDAEHAQEDKVISLLYPKTEYLTGLSAGSGNYVFDDIPTGVINVPEEYKDADFVIGVSGDSMEPTYYDGDKVAIKKCDHLNIGEIGAFMIDGSGYIKELGSGKLISHNKEYDDITINETTVCVGKVIGKI